MDFIEFPSIPVENTTKQCAMMYASNLHCVDKHLADLVGVVGVFAVFRVVVLKQEFAEAVFYDGPGMGLYFRHHAQHFDRSELVADNWKFLVSIKQA
ncbi:MAG: hypothetical protein K2P57_08845 [Burkholderiales bacterium]|nr:hypothetical protein [Burkholderiales bacterium]